MTRQDIMFRWLLSTSLLLWAGIACADDWQDCQLWREADKAIPACTKVVDAKGTGKATASDAYVFRGASFAFIKRDLARGLADFEQAIEANPKSGFAWYHRGVVKMQQGIIDGAIADFTQAIDANRYAAAYFSRGFLYYGQRQHDLAVADYSKAIEFGFATAEVYFRRAAALEEMGDRGRATEDYRLAAKSPPLDSDANFQREAQAALARLGVDPSNVAQLELPKGPRVALVVGNSAYKYTEPLANPHNDATALAARLRAIGFEVIEGIDVDVEKLAGRVRDFSRALKGASVGLFFYAGHGLQVSGVNYLVPVDATLADEGDVAYETVELNDVLKHMERQAKTNVVFLDACRNNPLARNLARSMGTRSTSLGQGLAEVKSGVGTFIPFATQPGNVALDGSGTNSPFTTALLKHLDTGGLDVTDMMRRVRKDVLEETSGRQVPWDHSSLTSTVVLNISKK